MIDPIVQPFTPPRPAFTAFNEEHFKQALERLEYVFAKFVFKVNHAYHLRTLHQKAYQFTSSVFT